MSAALLFRIATAIAAWTASIWREFISRVRSTVGPHYSRQTTSPKPSGAVGMLHDGPNGNNIIRGTEYLENLL